MCADVYPEKREGFHHLHFHCFPADTELHSDGFIGETFIPAHFKDALALGRQLTNGRLYKCIDLVVIKLPVRLKMLLRVVLLDIVCKRLCDLLPYFVEDLVAGNDKEIIFRALHLTEFFPVLPDGQEYFLNNVLCFEFVFQVSQGLAVEEVPVFVHQQRESRLIPFCDQKKELIGCI